MSSCSGSTFLKGIEKCPQCSPSRLMKAKMRSMSTKVSSSTFGCRTYTYVCLICLPYMSALYNEIDVHKGLLLHIRVPHRCVYVYIKTS